MKRALVCGGLMSLMLLCGCWKKAATTGPSSPGWSGFDPEQGKFAVAMPGTPKEQPLVGSDGKMWTSNADGLTYSVSYEVLQVPPGTSESDQAEQIMDNEVNFMVKTTQGAVLAGEKKPLMVGTLPGREVDIEIGGTAMRRIRMCLAGNRLYLVEVSGPKEKVTGPDVTSFLDSFKAK